MYEVRARQRSAGTWSTFENAKMLTSSNLPRHLHLRETRHQTVSDSFAQVAVDRLEQGEDAGNEKNRGK